MSFKNLAACRAITDMQIENPIELVLSPSDRSEILLAVIEAVVIDVIGLSPVASL